MRRINPYKAALSVGGVLGLYHASWATIVLADWAKPFLDLLLRLHFIRMEYEIAPFGFGTAGALIALTFTIGAIFGFVFALVWNWLSSQETDMKLDSRMPDRPVSSAQ